NCERLEYKQEWREGEKAGKVSILRDINIHNPHTGHLKILRELNIKERDIKTFSQLYEYWQSVFNVSILNKQFYKELSDWYFWAIKHVVFPNAPIQSGFGLEEESLKHPEVKKHNAENLIRLLTRLLFVWFIKEKGLIPEELFDESFITDKLLNNFRPKKKEGGFDEKTKSSTYYRAILQNLFFATLNKEMGKREFRKDGLHRNITNLMRYKKYFQDPQKFIDMLKDKVPFMNGGLFECLDKPHPEKKGKQGGEVIIYIDGFSDRDDNELTVPDYIFFGGDSNVDLSDDYGYKDGTKNLSIKGLINILKSYKFTIAENTPIEEDVALDPELLGKVFENLLASYNPETKTTARKQTGSFYTPREIVNYMVDESLIAHLKNKLISEFNDEKELDEKLHQLISYSDIQPFDNDNIKNKIIDSINNCKVLDPACGSGAFPMGILHKMTHILHKIDPKNEKWMDKQIKKAEEIDIDSARDNAIKDIEEAFENNELDYGRKLFLIENCIYGVDIQPIAVQISKLRFFISLVVDQKVTNNKENLGVRSLPNLETKFVAANTLISVEKTNSQNSLFDTPDIKRLTQELKDTRHKLFSVKDPKTKNKYRKIDKETREKIGNILKDKGIPNETAKLLSEWNPYDQNNSADFFDPEWMFGLNNGFDIVIGNPPYIQLQKNGGKLAKLYKQYNYKTLKSTGDIYALFYEKGINILKDKGYLVYITSNKWMRAGYGDVLRDFLSKKNPVKLIDFSGFKVFESATVDTNILIIQNSDNIKHTEAVQFKNDYKKGDDITEYSNKNKTVLDNLSKDNWFIGSKAEINLKAKIEKIGKPLKDWDVNIYYGIKTGYNEAFIIDTETKERLCKEDPKSEEIVKPILRGRDIKRYSYNWAGLWLINSHNGYINSNGDKVSPIDIKNYPVIKNHLDQYWDKLKKRQDKGITPYNLRNCAYLEEFEKEKIMYSEIVKQPQFYLDIHKEFYPEATAFILTGKNLKFLTSILHSKLFTYIFKSFYAGGGLGESGYRYKKAFIEQVPVPKVTDSNRKLVEEIESLVDNM
ncbi:MAG: Eco57I restriction-modification methylase domain-containing protein, partial [Spirochaetota bacterium]